ncbi:MAG: phosphatidate cytidylyltransferase [Spirochaetes bacterium]|nr:phosphatidate cytidylyltransferase [Spirochaetota bacterium]
MKEITKNTIKRIGSAVVFLPIYAAGVVTDRFYCIPILLVSTIISLVCLWEFYQMADRGKEGKAFVFEGMTVGLIINVFMYLFAFGRRFSIPVFFDYGDPRGIMFFIMLIIALTLFLQLFTREIRGATYSLGVTVFGVIFIVGFFSHIILLKSLQNGVYYILILNAVVMINDSGAFFGGVLFGRHRTGFAVSPNKTWEGYISGLLFCVLAMILFNFIFDYFYQVRLFSYPAAGLLGVIFSFMGNIGDLVESVMKRDNDVKDSGSIIPGHGGMWDVFDAMVFSMPVFYYYLVLTGAA